MIPPVTVEVENADALARTTDLLVLKYAQGLYGVDEAAAQRIGGLPHLPPPGEECIVRNPRNIGARTLLFLGVPSLWQFSYAQIREFGSRAITVPETLRLEAAEICVTIHGVGYGLDESEAFRAELAGILHAVTDGRAEATLRRVSILESDPSRAGRIQRLLADELNDPGDLRPARVFDTLTQRSVRHTLDSAGTDSATRRKAFVAMPFAPSFDDRFHYGISPPLHAAGMLCERMDTISFTGDIVHAMERRIRGAEVVVADISTANPNVYLEVGYAWAAGRPTILLCDAESTPQFNVRGQRYLKYTSIRDLEQKLAKEISELT